MLSKSQQIVQPRPQTGNIPPVRPNTTSKTNLSQSMSSTLPDINNSNSVVSQRHKALQKVLSKFPPDLRENVSSTLHLTLHENEQIKQKLSVLNVENSALKSELRSKQIEIQNLYQLSNSLKLQVNELEEASYDLKDKLAFRTKFMMVNKKSTNKITNVNKMLMDCLEALQDRPPNTQNKVLNFAAFESQELQSQSAGATGMMIGTGNTNALLALEDGSSSPINSSKLRESLMSVTNELSQFTRKNQLLEDKVQELSANLKKVKQENLSLQTEVNAMRTIGFPATNRRLNQSLSHPTDAGATLSLTKAVIGTSSFESGVDVTAITDDSMTKGTLKALNNLSTTQQSSNNKYFVKRKEFDQLDQKLQVLLTRNNVSSNDALLMLRRLVSHLCNSPSIVTVTEAAKLLTSKSALQIFDVEVITFFVTPFVEVPYSQLFHKYSSEIPNGSYESYQMEDFNCIAFQVAKYNKMIKLNSFNEITTSAYNPVVDCHNNIAVRNIISFPIIDIQTSRVIAVLQMLNKRNQLGKGFSEFDEIFGSIYCNSASFLLNTCSRSTRTMEQSNIMTRILGAPNELLMSIQEKIDFMNQKSSTVIEPIDLLDTLEVTIEKLLKCGKVKAFIPSNKVDMEPGLLMFLEDKKSNRLANGSYMKALRNDAGLIGDSLRTRSIRIVDGIETEALINSDIDMDPFGQTLVSVPVLDITGEVLALYQIAVSKSNHSLFVVSPENPDNSIIVINQYLANQLSFALTHLFEIRKQQMQSKPRIEPHNTGKFGGLPNQQQTSTPLAINQFSFGKDANMNILTADDDFDPDDDARFKADDFPAVGENLTPNARFFSNRQNGDDMRIHKLTALLAKREINDKDCFSLVSTHMNTCKVLLTELKQLPEYHIEVVRKHIDELEIKVVESLNKIWESEKFLNGLDYKNSVLSITDDTQLGGKSNKSFNLSTSHYLGLRVQEEEMILKKNAELLEKAFTYSKQIKDKDELIKHLKEDLEITQKELDQAKHMHDDVSLTSSRGHNWEEHKDDEGRIFYYNAITGVSLWEKPSVISKLKPAQPLLDLVRVGDWLQQYDAEGNTYWLNVMTGVSEWEIPTWTTQVHHSDSANSTLNNSISSSSSSSSDFMKDNKEKFAKDSTTNRSIRSSGGGSKASRASKLKVTDTSELIQNSSIASASKAKSFHNTNIEETIINNKKTDENPIELLPYDSNLVTSHFDLEPEHKNLNSVPPVNTIPHVANIVTSHFDLEPENGNISPLQSPTLTQMILDNSVLEQQSTISSLGQYNLKL